VIVSDKALIDVGWNSLLAHWSKRCMTQRGSQSALHPFWFAFSNDAVARFQHITEARLLLSRSMGMSLVGVVDVRSALARVQKAAALEAPDLIAVATSAKVMTACRIHLFAERTTVPTLAVIAGQIAELGHVFLPILDGFDADGRLVDHASDDLGPLRKTVAGLKTQLERRMNELLADEKYAPYLQDTYHTEREDRCVLPVRTDGKGFVRGIVHGTSQSGQTLFIEPDEIIELNNRKKLAECDVADEERRILARYSGWVAEEAPAILQALDAAELLDVIHGAARLAEDTVATAPTILSEPKIALLHARHPLMLLAERRCVANDVAVATGQTMIISGPNAGGKTVAIKTVALAALMVRAGLHIAAESGSAIGWFERVVTDIGDAQSLEQNLSTFSGHMQNLSAILRQSGPATLVLIDEVAAGTDPEQGAVLAQSYLEALADKGVTAIVTTHFERLKGLAATESRFCNASVGFDMAKLEPTFKLHMGVPGSSGAFAVAKRMGLPTSVVESAQRLLGGNATRIDDLLTNVAEQRRRLEDERAMVLAELEAAEADRASMRIARERIVSRYEKQTRSAHSDAASALKVVRRELDELRRQIKDRAVRAAADTAAVADLDNEHAAAVRSLNRGVAAVAHVVAQHEPTRAKLPGTIARVADLVPGVAVLVAGIGKGQSRAVVEELASDGKVTVRMGALRATIAIQDVMIDSHRAARRAAEQANRDHTPDKPNGLPPLVIIDVSHDGRAAARTLETTIDVRGSRMDEAVAAVDRFVDEGLMGAKDILFVVHGHGTGVLRTAIRSHLQIHKAVKSVRPGSATEGGDGVTVMFLKDEA
jgi:DNA mismatch repair protein MutS2